MMQDASQRPELTVYFVATDPNETAADVEAPHRPGSGRPGDDRDSAAVKIGPAQLFAAAGR
jgi:hypothetical protein